MADIKVRVGQTDAIKVLSSVDRSTSAVSVSGGTANVTQLTVSGSSSINTLNATGIATFNPNTTPDITGIIIDGENEQLKVGIGVTITDGNIFAKDLADFRILNISGISTFAGLVDINDGGQANTFKVEDLTNNRVVIAGNGGELEDDSNLTFDGSLLSVGANLDVDGHTEIDNLNVSGIATFNEISISSSSDVNIAGNLDVDGNTELNTLNVSNTATIGGDLSASANLNISGDLDVGGDLNISGIISATFYAESGTFSSGEDTESDVAIVIEEEGVIYTKDGLFLRTLIEKKSDIINIGQHNTVLITGIELKPGTSGSVKIHHGGTTDNVKLQTTGYGITITGGISASGIATLGELNVDGHTELDNLNVSGVSTFIGNIDANANLDINGHTELDNLNVSGIATFNEASITSNVLNITNNLDVDGHTELNNVNVTGLSTFAGFVDINGGGQANTFKVEDLTSGRVVFAGTDGELEDSANLIFDGSNLTISGNVSIGGALSYQDVENIDSTGIITARSGIIISSDGLDVTGVSTFRDNINANGDINVDGHTELDNLRVSGISTFASTIDADGDLDVDGHTELDNLRVSGVSTFVGISTFQNNVFCVGVSTFQDDLFCVGTLTAGLIDGGSF